jgi:hypothetical protein
MNEGVKEKSTEMKEEGMERKEEKLKVTLEEERWDSNGNGQGERKKK